MTEGADTSKNRPAAGRRLLVATLLILIAFVVMGIWLPSPVCSAPLVQGVLTRTEVCQGESVGLQLLIGNPTQETITVRAVEIPSEGLTLDTDTRYMLTILAPAKSTLWSLLVNAKSPGTWNVGAVVHWSDQKEQGPTLVNVGEIRIRERPWLRVFYGGPIRILESLLGSAVVIALASIAVDAIRRSWDMEAQRAVRRDEVIRRMTEQVHALIQKHYEVILSWANAFDKECRDLRDSGLPMNQQDLRYWCYLLAVFVSREDKMDDESGAYFYGDPVAERLLGYLMWEVDGILVDGAQLTDEEYSALVTVLGGSTSFLAFKNTLGTNAEAASAFAKLQTFASAPIRSEGLRRRIRLKARLLSIHNAATYADWYNRALPANLTQQDLDMLQTVLSEMQEKQSLEPDVAARYRETIEGLSRVVANEDA